MMNFKDSLQIKMKYTNKPTHGTIAILYSYSYLSNFSAMAQYSSKPTTDSTSVRSGNTDSPRGGAEEGRGLAGELDVLAEKSAKADVSSNHIHDLESGHRLSDSGTDIPTKIGSNPFLEEAAKLADPTNTVDNATVNGITITKRAYLTVFEATALMFRYSVDVWYKLYFTRKDVRRYNFRLWSYVNFIRFSLPDNLQWRIDRLNALRAHLTSFRRARTIVTKIGRVPILYIRENGKISMRLYYLRTSRLYQALDRRFYKFRLKYEFSWARDFAHFMNRKIGILQVRFKYRPRHFFVVFKWAKWKKKLFVAKLYYPLFRYPDVYPFLYVRKLRKYFIKLYPKFKMQKKDFRTSATEAVPSGEYSQPRVRTGPYHSPIQITDFPEPISTALALGWKTLAVAGGVSWAIAKFSFYHPYVLWAAHGLLYGVLGGIDMPPWVELFEEVEGMDEPQPTGIFEQHGFDMKTFLTYWQNAAVYLLVDIPYHRLVHWTFDPIFGWCYDNWIHELVSRHPFDRQFRSTFTWTKWAERYWAHIEARQLERAIAFEEGDKILLRVVKEELLGTLKEIAQELRDGGNLDTPKPAVNNEPALNTPEAGDDELDESELDDEELQKLIEEEEAADRAEYRLQEKIRQQELEAAGRRFVRWNYPHKKVKPLTGAEYINKLLAENPIDSDKQDNK